MKGFFSVEVESCLEKAKGIFLLSLSTGEFANSLPGQFAILEPLNSKSILPRPFAVYDADKERVQFLINVVGENTWLYSQLKRREKIRISGPHGQGFSIDEGASDYLLFGGGIGLASLSLLTKHLCQKNKNVKVFLGAKTAAELYFSKFTSFLCGLKIITEQGDGKTGLVTDLLEEELGHIKKNTVIVACGPKQMLKKVAQLSQGYECFVILEKIMACGIGSCKGCQIFLKDGSVKHVCQDGPVFRASLINWADFCPEIVKTVSRKALSKEPFKTILFGKKANLKLEYPTMNASGTLHLPAIKSSHVDITKFGALVTKGIRLKAHAGNHGQRICEIPGGLLNAIGLEGAGIMKFVREVLPVWQSFGKPVIVNIFGSSIYEYGFIADILSNFVIGGIEVNVSCSNTEGKIFGLSPESTYNVVKRVRNYCPKKFILAKLSPMASNIVEIAKAAVTAGADGLTLINTLQGMKIDVLKAEPEIGIKYGGMSGEVIRPLGVRMVHQVAQANLGVPIIGVGGVVDGYSAAEYFMAGAGAIQVGTELFSRPDVMNKVCAELEFLMKHHGVENISGLVKRC